MAVPRALRWLLLGTGAFVALILFTAIGCTLLHPDATTRLARQFGLDDVSSEQAIAAGLAAKLPVGSSEEAVATFLTSSGVGKDELSSWYPADKDGVIVCRVEFDPSSFGLVKESYGIWFRLDERRQLAGIEAKRWYTGL